MEYIFRVWDKIEKKLAHKFIFLFLDYDGTLASIAPVPQRAVLPKQTKEILAQLIALADKYKLAIISGRSLNDIKQQAALKKVIYAGNHGLEIEGSRDRFINKVSSHSKKIIKIIGDDLRAGFSGIKGALVEDKGFSLSIHYRLVEKNNIPRLKNILNRAVEPYVARNKIKVNRGKKVFEIKPLLDWDKGKAVLWLLKTEQLPCRKKEIMPVYIGDDRTDEDAFIALRNKGITIFVGRNRNSAADYYLKNIQEVNLFLTRIKSCGIPAVLKHPRSPPTAERLRNCARQVSRKT